MVQATRLVYVVGVPRLYDEVDMRLSYYELVL